LAIELVPVGPARPAIGGAVYLGAFYRFLDYAAEVQVRCPSRAAYLAIAERLRRLLQDATVDWPDPAAATLAGLCS
jgi:hypothetical protein